MTFGLVAIPGSAGAASGSGSTSPQPAVKASAKIRAELAKLEARARAEAATGHAARQLPRGSGSITGHVLGPNELPIPGACVTAVGQSRTMTATAGANGAFRIGGLAAGSYALEYRGCAAPGHFLTRWSGATATISTAARIRVTAGGENHVPAMTLMSTNPAANMPNLATWHKMLAASAGQGMSAAAAATAGRISGVVTGRRHRLHGICVIALPLRSGEAFGATTARDGTYTMRHVKPGRYHVIFAGFACPSTSNWLQQVYRGHNTPFPFGGNAVHVVSGKTTKHINAALRLGGEISGTVRSASGTRLAGICVNINGNVRGGTIGFGLPTSRNGTYHLHALYPGRYSIEFTTGCGNTGNYAPARHAPIRIHGQVVSGVNATLSVGASITGTVRLGSSSGTPLAGICVTASNRSGTIFSGTESASDGTYQVVGLGTGKYQVQFLAQCTNNGNYAAATVNAQTTVGQVTSGVDGVMQPGAQISGVVTNTQGKPVTGLCIALSGPDTYLANFAGQQADGSYVINQLAASTYQLGFISGCGNTGSYSPYWYNGQTTQGLAAPISLAVGGSQTINPVMQPGVTISGTVTDARGRRLPGVCVFADGKQLSGVVGGASTGSRGRYSIKNLAPGQYQIDFGCGLSSKYADQWYANAPDAVTARFLDLSAGTTSGINAVLQPAGSISGKVTSKSGRPLKGICVSATNTRDLNSAAAIFLGGPGQATNANGVYKLSGLAAGRYVLQFSDCQSAQPLYSQQWYRHTASLSSATPVRAKAGTNTPGINGQLAIGGKISGHALGAASNALRNICVAAINGSSGSFGFALTRKDGSYSISGLGTGRYFVEFQPCNGQNLVSVFTTATVRAPLTTTRINGTLVPGGSIAGTVTTAGQSSVPVSFICVDVFSSDPANLGGFAATNSDGTYLATGLAAGSYTVFFDPTCGAVPLASQWYNSKSSLATADSITVTVGQTTTGIDAAMQPDGEITGSVLGPSATNVTGACVTAVPLDGQLPAPFVAVSKAGSYSLAQLPPGRYKVKFSSGCGATGYVTQWWQNAATRRAATVVTVSAGQTVSGISATLAK